MTEEEWSLERDVVSHVEESVTFDNTRSHQEGRGFIDEEDQKRGTALLTQKKRGGTIVDRTLEGSNNNRLNCFRQVP